MQLAIDRGSGRFDIGDVEELPVSSTGIARADRFADDGARAIAPGDVTRLANVFMTFGPAKTGGDAIALIREADQFSSPLDRDAELLEPLDQKPLMLVLGEDLEEGIWRQVRADRLEKQARRRLALHPEIDGGDLVASLHNGVGEVQLSVEFERPRLNRQGPRGGPRFGRLVDDAHLGAKLG